MTQGQFKVIFNGNTVKKLLKLSRHISFFGNASSEDEVVPEVGVASWDNELNINRS